MRAEWPADAVERRPVAALVPYARNARTHSAAQVEQIAASIREWGWTVPVLVDEAGGIIAGHGRVLAAQKLGLADVPTVTARGWSEEQKRAYVLADNKLTLNGGWDDDLLRGELVDLRATGFDLNLTGFDAAEIGALLAPNGGGHTDPDEAPPAPAVPVSALGDVWVLGPHRVVCGDSTAPQTVAAALRGYKPRIMVTDPPYGVKYDPAWRKEAGLASAGLATGKVQNDDRADWREAWALFPGAVAYVWHGGLHAATVAASLEAVGLKVRAQIVWVKTRAAISRGAYHWQHEPCLYAVSDGEDDGWRFVPEHEVAAYSVRDGKTAEWRGGRKQSTVWFMEHIKSETGHGTQKPIEAMRRPIENNSGPGEVVYDPFLGSGTTLIAATASGRVCCGCELDPRYVDVIVRRWQDFTQLAAALEGDGRTFQEVAAARGVKIDG